MVAFFTRTATAYRETNCPAYLCVFPCSILILFFLYSIYITLDVEKIPADAVIDYLQHNLNMHPITYIRTTDTDCPENFEEVVLGNWPGVFSEGDGKPGSGPIPLHFWRDEIFCIQRLENFKYTLDECPEGYKRCQPDLCIFESDICPITGIKFLKQLPDGVNGDKPKENYEREMYFQQGNIAIGDKLYSIERNVDSHPIVDIQVSFYGPPCYALDKIPQKKTPPYRTMRAQYGCGEYGADTHTHLVDSMSEYDLYEDNTIDRQLADIPGYLETIEGEIVYLAFRPRVKLANDQICYQDDYGVTKESAGELFENVISHDVTLISLMGIQLFILAYCFVGSCCVGCGDTETKENMHEFNRLTFIFTLLAEFIFVVALFILVGWNAQELKIADTSLNNLLTQNCLQDAELSAAGTDFHENLGDIPEDVSSYVLWIVLAFLAKALYTIWILIRRM